MKNKTQNKSKNKVDWFIHLVANGTPCMCCDRVENSFKDYLCNAHTHGMEKYNHLDFQLVLHISSEEIMYILNELGLRVQAGEKFKNGDMVSGIFLDCDVRLMEVTEMDRKVLRVIIPDSKNRFPENPDCDYPYNQQFLSTEDLCKPDYKHKH